ncbi:hypothetical protein BC826DRAFT_1119451 [Russula brevipes]|nr:hypothetical protein BC826DRAFT_1119451 [Russula brevipes]
MCLYPICDVEGYTHMSEAEGALICQNVAPPAEGVTKLVALEDTLVWTASGSSSLQHWRMPSHRAQTRAPALSRLTYLRRQLHTHRRAMQTRAAEGETTWFGLPYDRLVHLALPLSDPFTRLRPSRLSIAVLAPVQMWTSRRSTPLQVSKVGGIRACGITGRFPNSRSVQFVTIRCN